jgi:hypothetical protein
MMLLWKRVMWCVALAAGLSAASAWAKDEPAKTPASETKAVDAKPGEAPKAAGEDIAKLVQQLDADRFNDRQAASEKLAAIGKPAVAALAKAAVGDSLEATTRAIGLLGKMLESSDKDTKDAARAALETIAKSDKPAAARRAQELVKPAAPEPQPGMPGNIGQGMIQIQVGNMGVGRRSMKNINGVKEIDVDEDGKKVKITDDPQNGIKIEATTKKEGKDVTEKYEAKDAKELEKKHPEGYKLYKEYAENQGGMGGIQIQGGNIQLIPGQLPQMPGIQLPQMPGIELPQMPGMQPIAGAQRVEMATQLMQHLGRQLESVTKDLKDAPQESKDALKKQIDELKKQLAEVEKQLQEK